MDQSNPAIVVMAKAPQPGHVKTRLRPALSDEQCAELARCFLLDTITKMNQISATTVVAYTPDGSGDAMRSLLHGKARFMAQRGSDIGERLESAIAEADADGFGPVVVIGTDSPTLPASFITSAVEYLLDNVNGIVIGPADDGGYYLIGMSRPQTMLFNRIPWSTGNVFERTIAQAKEIPDVSILELPSWYDIDEPADLSQLISEFENDEMARLAAPETFRWLSGNPLDGELDRVSLDKVRACVKPAFRRMR